MNKDRYCSPLETNIIITNNAGEVLLCLRENTGFADGMWCLPSGKVEANESPKQAITRECTEEIGAYVNDVEFSSVISTMHPDFFDKSITWQSLAFFFSATSWTGEISNNEPQKHADVKFFSIDKLPSNILPVCIKGLENHIQKINFSEFHNRAEAA